MNANNHIKNHFDMRYFQGHNMADVNVADMRYFLCV